MISIITITYNNYDELIKTLNSIPQTPYIESVVINGGQCEKTKEFLRNYQGKSISEADDGIADAFNKGVKYSSGTYIMFLNSGDVLLDKSYFERALNLLDQKKDISFIHSNLLLVDFPNPELFMRPTLSNLGRGMSYLHPTMIVKKDLFEIIGWFNKNIKVAMDFDWIVRLEKHKIQGHYFNGNAVVQMDGKGKSINQENVAIKECYSILKSNNYLTLTNLAGFSQRYLLYLLRMIMVKIGLKDFLMSMKKVKYSE
jgi:glycosyltransferase involved in cell wall biosynthesis